MEPNWGPEMIMAPPMGTLESLTKLVKAIEIEGMRMREGLASEADDWELMRKPKNITQKQLRGAKEKAE